jgi:hypothetical protein
MIQIFAIDDPESFGMDIAIVHSDEKGIAEIEIMEFDLD